MAKTSSAASSPYSAQPHTPRIESVATASAGAMAAFPTDPSEFDSDDRISFSKLDGKFLLVQDDGSEFEFDDAMKRWIPVLDEALLEEQQRAYKVSGVDESAPVEAGRKKRKAEYVNGEDVSVFSFSLPDQVACAGNTTSVL
jgi:hypothetical protein